MKRFAALTPLFLSVSSLLAQDESPTATVSPTGAGDAAAGAGAALLGGGCAFLYCGSLLAVWLGIAIWVTKDANRRNSPNASLVKILAWIPPTTIIGLIVHLVTRPKNGAGTGTGTGTTPPPTI